MHTHKTPGASKSTQQAYVIASRNRRFLPKSITIRVLPDLGERLRLAVILNCPLDAAYGSNERLELGDLARAYLTSTPKGHTLLVDMSVATNRSPEGAGLTKERRYLDERICFST